MRAWPARDVVCFRGQQSLSRAVIDDEVVLDGACVATTDAAVATENFATPGVLAVAASARRVVHRGRAHDGEVVLMPGTRLRVVGQARSDRLVVTLLAEEGSGLDAAEVGRRAAAAIRRDRAHEPHPDLTPGRFVGDLAAAPPGTWSLDDLESAESPDFTTMSTEQVQAWFATRQRSSAERFQDAPPGRLNPQKVADHPHLSQVGWEVRFAAGVPCLLTLGDDARPGVVVGLQRVEGSEPGRARGRHGRPLGLRARRRRGLGFVPGRDDRQRTAAGRAGGGVAGGG